MPYDSAVAVVSGIKRRQLSPAICAASSNARRCASVEYTGQLMTQSAILAPWSFSAITLSSPSSIAITCSVVNLRSSPRYWTVISGYPSAPSVTLYRASLISSCSSGSLNFLPKMRLILFTVFTGFVAILWPAMQPRNLCFGEKATIEGVIRPDSAFNTTSIPLRLASPTTEVSLPQSNPATLMVIKLRVFSQLSDHKVCYC
mmetsp:Transcript_36037/g.60724  ORF Transcript_36037/g.60724 Transcript_36037/m.60724 type:complete len:202 (-) Transcript_36037:124-729(-)